MEIVDLQLDITVTVTKNGESFAFTRTYDRTVKYDSDGSQAKTIHSQGVLHNKRQYNKVLPY